MQHTWTCRCCGKQFSSLPLSFALAEPDPAFAIPEAERNQRVRLDGDACVIDGQEFYLRGCLEVPIVGVEEPFVWNVWVSLSSSNFDRVAALWSASDRRQDHLFFGWLSSDLGLYPRTSGLKTHVHLRNNGLRPLIEFEPTDHPLAVEQRNGISVQRVEEIAAAVLRHS
jgi:hypothetical protein